MSPKAAAKGTKVPKVGDVVHMEGRDYTITAINGVRVDMAADPKSDSFKDRDPITMHLDDIRHASASEIGDVIEAETDLWHDKYTSQAAGVEKENRRSRVKAASAKAVKTLGGKATFYLADRLLIPANREG